MSSFLSNPYKQTISLCPECYRRIPAWIHLTNDGVMMQKICCDHGATGAMVERDVEFYLKCAQSNAPTIYAGYFIDVTRKCNLQCKYCYYPTDNKLQDRSIVSIVQEAILHQPMAPFILTGGEPTLRNDLPEIIETLRPIGTTTLLTNGTGICEDLLDKIIPMNSCGDVSHVHVSYHPEINADNLRVFELFRERKLKIDSVLFVIDDINQIDDVLTVCDEWKDIISATRIKAATRVWNDNKSDKKIFVSDMLKVFKYFGAKVVWWGNNKVSFVTVELNGMQHMLVSWYDVNNIDMIDINCAPYYQAKTGETTNFLTAMLINEGLEKGWMNGKKIKE